MDEGEFYRRVCKIARVEGYDPEDVALTALLRAKRGPPYDPRRPFHAYCRMYAKRAIGDLVRKRKPKCLSIDHPSFVEPIHPVIQLKYDGPLLTDSELRVMQAFVDYGTVVRVAEAMCKSKSAVRSHQYGVYKKLGVSTLLEAVLALLRDDTLTLRSDPSVRTERSVRYWEQPRKLDL